ncbi:transcriptional regulator FtrA [Pseudomonas japonica]|uniref:transcriptional regulator FtrA n=1 Tax=Pseudomonas japonica TaxID=256466 RepID=UPI0015E44B50|nr:transcriptional regulator FtrA [Pseudomonas japonica]MBA1242175.1 transcriptional regulator FtrA [Pseudomonas japonica]
MNTSPGLVAILAYDGLCTFEFGIAVEIFGLARPEFDFPWYSHRIVAADSGPMRAMGGIQVIADVGLDALAQANTVVIPGWRSRDERPPAALLHAIQAAHARGARLVSICSGVFVLAAAGLLDGQRATTHWRYTDELAERYPAIEVDPDVLYVDAGQIITSAGSAAGIDACLHLVARDFGTAVANSVARRLVMAPQRAGGQLQFIPAPVARNSRNDLAQVLDWARQQLHKPLSVAAMADRALMSERTFLRRFTETTGLTPKAWLQQSRLALARELLEGTTLPLERLAERCGFGSIESLRLAFRKHSGLAPSAYRERFGKARGPSIPTPGAEALP